MTKPQRKRSRRRAHSKHYPVRKYDAPQAGVNGESRPKQRHWAASIDCPQMGTDCPYTTAQCRQYHGAAVAVS
jgi:hypothetical protein